MHLPLLHADVSHAVTGRDGMHQALWALFKSFFEKWLETVARCDMLWDAGLEAVLSHESKTPGFGHPRQSKRQL